MWLRRARGFHAQIAGRVGLQGRAPSSGELPKQLPRRRCSRGSAHRSAVCRRSFTERRQGWVAVRFVTALGSATVASPACGAHQGSWSVDVTADQRTGRADKVWRAPRLDANEPRRARTAWTPPWRAAGWSAVPAARGSVRTIARPLLQGPRVRCAARKPGATPLTLSASESAEGLEETRLRVRGEGLGRDRAEAGRGFFHL